MSRADELRQMRNKAIAAHANVTLITGPPCSGKTTYVNEHKQPNDIVIDYDQLAVALGSPDTHNHPEHIRSVTTSAWLAAISAAHKTGHKTWLIRTFPTPNDTSIAKETITLDVDADTCKQRATHDGRPDTWHEVINAWWNNRR